MVTAIGSGSSESSESSESSVHSSIGDNYVPDSSRGTGEYISCRYLLAEFGLSVQRFGSGEGVVGSQRVKIVAERV